MSRSPVSERGRRRPPAEPQPGTAVAAEQYSAGGPVEPPTCHIDLCCAGDGWVVALGWVVRAPTAEPDAALLVGERRVAPVVLFPRPDVIDYFTHSRSALVRRSDIAYSFVLAAPAAGSGDARLSLQGHVRPLEAVPLPPDRQLDFLDRYLDALRPLAVSPAVVATRRALQALRMRHAAHAPETDAGADMPPASVEDLLAACRTEGKLFEQRGHTAPMLALFAIHQPGPFLTHQHRAMLEALRERGCATVLVNSHPHSRAGAAALREGLADGAITRPDHGRDIASWLLALTLLAQPVTRAGHVLFCNDSFFGPFDALGPALAHHAESGADLWALSDSWEHGWHAQSSFFALSARALASDAFAQFRAEYGYPDAREAVVRQGEIGLSRLLVQDRSLAVRVVAPYARLARHALDEASRTLQALRALPEHVPHPRAPGEPTEAEPALAFMRGLLSDLRNGVPRNPQHVFWEALLRDYRIPFVKRDLLQRNPAGVPDYWRILPAITSVFGTGHAERVEQDMRLGSQRAPVA